MNRYFMKRIIKHVFRAYVETFKHVPPGAMY
ncbi:stress response protein AzuC [Pantoea vagans]|nr:stress response protein AzuC [Pantoea vagans]QZX95873.1 stress response protein AzuC [Pantoea alfalfae]